MKQLQGVVFESKAWEIQVDEGMVFVINKRFESEGRYEACTEVTSDMVESFEIKGVKVPKYLREELALLFVELEALEKQETEMEFVGIKDVNFDIHSNDRPARVYKDQYGLFTSYKYRDIYSGERLGFICIRENKYGEFLITFDPHELAKYRDGRSTLEEYQATLRPVEEKEEEEQVLKGWILNGQKPTGRKVWETWKGKRIESSILKFTFVKDFDFNNKIELYEVSERGAWNQLRERLTGQTVEEAPEVTMEDRHNITLVTTAQAQFALIIGKRYTVHYKDEHGEYELANMLYLGHSVQKDVLFFGTSFEEILHVDPLKMTALWIDLQLQE
jgi:hypothetical protein